MYTILYISEHNQFRNKVVKSLSNSFNLLVADFFEEGIEILTKHSIEIVLIDCEVIDDRINMCKTIRHYLMEYIPILIATSSDCTRSVQSIFDAGADAHINLSTMSSILTAKIEAMIRFKNSTKPSVDLRIEDIVISKSDMTLSRKGLKVMFKRREFQVLFYLASNCGSIVTRDQIVARFWDEKPIASNSIDVHITRIRNKLIQLSSVIQIETIYGLGYKFVCLK